MTNVGFIKQNGCLTPISPSPSPIPSLPLPSYPFIWCFYVMFMLFYVSVVFVIVHVTLIAKFSSGWISWQDKYRIQEMGKSVLPSPRYWYTSIGWHTTIPRYCANIWITWAFYTGCKYHIFGKYWTPEIFQCSPILGRSAIWDFMYTFSPCSFPRKLFCYIEKNICFLQQNKHEELWKSLAASWKIKHGID